MEDEGGYLATAWPCCNRCHQYFSASFLNGRPFFLRFLMYLSSLRSVLLLDELLSQVKIPSHQFWLHHLCPELKFRHFTLIFVPACSFDHEPMHQKVQYGLIFLTLTMRFFHLSFPDNEKPTLYELHNDL